VLEASTQQAWFLRCAAPKISPSAAGARLAEAHIRQKLAISLMPALNMEISMFSEHNVTLQMGSNRAQRRLFSAVAVLNNANCALELAKATTRTAEALSIPS